MDLGSAGTPDVAKALAGCKYAVPLGFLVRDAFREVAGALEATLVTPLLTCEPTIVCACVRAACVGVTARARTRAIVACSKYLVSTGLSSSRRLRVSR